MRIHQILALLAGAAVLTFTILPAFSLKHRLEKATHELYEAALANNRLAVMEERHRIAQELHDTVSQTLFDANLIAEGIRETIKNDPDEAYARLGDYLRATQSALAGMRLMLIELHPGDVTDVPLDLVLMHLMQTIWGHAGLEIETKVSGSSTTYPGDVQLALYRITQQAIANTIQHAEATRITFQLKQAAQSVTITIEDDGIGFNPTESKPGHFGIPFMQQRARSTGIDLAIDSQPGNGTRIMMRWEREGADGDPDSGG